MGLGKDFRKIFYGGGAIAILLSLLLMLGIDAFHEGNSLGKDSNVTSKDAIYHHIDCVFTLMKATSLEVRIDY